MLLIYLLKNGKWFFKNNNNFRNIFKLSLKAKLSAIKLFSKALLTRTGALVLIIATG